MNNKAALGAGVNIVLSPSSRDLGFGGQATVSRCTFEGNTAAIRGGGGISITWKPGFPYANSISLSQNVYTANSAAYAGGALYVDTENVGLSAFLTVPVANSVFACNHAEQNGAAIATTSLAHPVDYSITNSEFSNNVVVGSGAAVLGWSANAKTVITNSMFRGNVAKSQGAALSFRDFRVARVQNCEFYDNAASAGACMYAVAVQIDCDPTGFFAAAGPVVYISSSTFVRNTAETVGGALVLERTFSVVEGSTFEDNAARTQGGAILLQQDDLGVPKYFPLYCSRDPVTNLCSHRRPTTNDGVPCAASFADGSNPVRAPTIANCIFSRNQAATQGGAVSILGKHQVEMKDNTFNGNSAGRDFVFGTGGAVFVRLVQYTGFLRNVFLNNGATRAGAVRVMGGEMYMVNNTFSTNFASLQAGALWLDEATSSASACDYTCSDLWDGATGSAFPWCATAMSPCQTVVTHTAFQGNLNNQTLWLGSSTVVNPACEDACCESGFGGGAVQVSSPRALFFRSTFENNIDVSRQGGGALTFSSTGTPTKLRLDHCNFTANIVYHKGGAIYMPFSAVGSSLHDIGGIYQRNIAALGGAVCLEGGNSLGSFSGAAFIKNSAGLDRQSDVLMVYKRYAGTRSSYQPRLFGGKGAGILAQGVVLQVNDSFFQGHVSQYGSIHLDPFSTGIINSTVFRANAAHVAGG